MSTPRRRRALLAAALALVLAPSAPGQKTLIDDFSSGTDAAWTHEDGFMILGLGSTTYSVIGGAYSLAGPAITPPGFGVLTGGFFTDSVTTPGPYADGVYRATVSLLGPNAATLGIRSSSGGAGIVFGYTFEVEAFGASMVDLRIRRFDGLGGDVVLSSAVVPWAGGDIELRGRAVGSVLQLTMWDAGSPQPHTPQLTVVDATYGGGALGVGMRTTPGDPGPFEARLDDLFFGFPQDGPVVIHELLADAAGADDGLQFIELSGPVGADLSGWRLRDVDASGGSCGTFGTSVELPVGAAIGPDGLYLLADATGGVTSVVVDPGHNGGAADLLVEDLDLDDDHAGLTLSDAAGIPRDAVGRAAPFVPLCTTADAEGHPLVEGRPAIIPPAGFSLTRVPGAADGDDNVLDLRASGCPSPGAVEAGCAGVWADLGFALTGTTGDPALTGAGPLVAGTPLTVVLANALPGTTINLVLGFSDISVPFKGGVLVPSPDLLFLGLPADGDGSFALSDTWPAGIPAGLPSFLQYWISDPVGPKGLSTSNGLSGTSQ